MSTTSLASAARRTDDEGRGPYLLTGRAWDLWQRASSGRGMVDIAAATYRSADWSLVSVVFHEVGHAAAARAHGQLAWITLDSPSSGFCHRTGDRYWAAETVRTFALAGPIAEHLAKYGPWTSDRDLQVCIHPQSMSVSDRIQAGNFTGGDVAACADLLRRCWPAIEAESSQVLARELARWGAVRC